MNEGVKKRFQAKPSGCTELFLPKGGRQDVGTARAAEWPAARTAEVSRSLRTARMEGTPANGEPREGGKDEALSRRSALMRLFGRCWSMLPRREVEYGEEGSRVQQLDGLSDAGFFSQKRPVPTCSI